MRRWPGVDIADKFLICKLAKSKNVSWHRNTLIPYRYGMNEATVAAGRERPRCGDAPLEPSHQTRAVEYVTARRDRYVLGVTVREQFRTNRACDMHDSVEAMMHRFARIRI